MRRALLFPLTALIAMGAGCSDRDASRDTVDPQAQARVAEAEARTAEAEARAAEAEARLAEVQATARTEVQPVRSAEPSRALDYVPYDTPRVAVVQTMHEGQITLRADPRADARRVARVADGTHLVVLGCQSEATVRRDAASAGTPGRWCFVRSGRADGWAFDAYLLF